MTQEDKELLLKDLSARLPYYIKVAINYEIYLNFLPDEKFKEHFLFLLEYDKKTIEEKSLEPHTICSYPCRNRFMTFTGCHNEYGVPIEAIKPYLRPMSSMTESEKKDILQSLNIHGDIDNEGNLLLGVECDIITLKVCKKYLGELNKRMFDVCHMIEKGLALEAPEGMYTLNK